MRILYHHRIASKDGQITPIEEMVHALKDLGHEVRVVGPDVHQGDSGKGGSPGWVGLLKKYLPAALYELAEAGYALLVYRRLMKAMAEFKPDVVYERYSLYQPAGVWASRRTGIPLLLEVNAPYAISRRKYSTIALGGLADWCERYTFCGATRVFPVTQVLADMLVGMGVQRQRIKVVPNGINPKDFVGVPSKEQAQATFGLEHRMVIGFIGFVREWDQLDRIVTWLSLRPKDDPAMLLVVGDGPVRPELEAQASKLGIAHKLRFTGVVPRTQVPAAAAAFDVALQTALVPYASPLCLFEYMALGKAILAPDQANHHEVLVGGVDADLYKPDDPQGIEQRLTVLAGDAALRARLGAGARQALTDRQYLWSGNAKRVSEAAQQAVAQRTQRA